MTSSAWCIKFLIGCKTVKKAGRKVRFECQISVKPIALNLNTPGQAHYTVLRQRVQSSQRCVRGTYPDGNLTKYVAL